MLRNLNQERATGRICGIPYDGVLAAAIPTGGDYPALGLNDIDPGDPVGCRYSVEVLWLSAGEMYAYEDTGFIYTPPSVDFVGTVTGMQRVRKNGVVAYDEDIGFAYAAATTSVSSDLAASYGVQAYVGASIAAAYAVDSALSMVSADLVAAYAVSAEVSASLAGGYAVTQFINASMSAVYAINAAVSADLVVLYAVAGGEASTAVGADLACAYMLSAYVRVNLAATYAVQAITNYARAPSGSGYAPRRTENQSRPASTQRNDR